MCIPYFQLWRSDDFYRGKMLKLAIPFSEKRIRFMESIYSLTYNIWSALLFEANTWELIRPSQSHHLARN